MSSLWREPLIIPAYFAIVSTFVIVIGVIWCSRGRIWPGSEVVGVNRPPKPDEQHPVIASQQHADFFSEIGATIRAHGVALFALRCIRLTSCLALVAITGIAFIQKEESEAGDSLINQGGKRRRRLAQALRHKEWIEIIQCAFYVCCECQRKLPSSINLTIKY